MKGDFGMDDSLKEVGARIKEVRKKRKMSQVELAEKINISISHLCDIETGRTNFGVDIFMRITEALQVSADVLLRTDVPEVDVLYAAEFEELMGGCSSTEKEAMLRTLRSMKAVFLENRK